MVAEAGLHERWSRSYSPSLEFIGRPRTSGAITMAGAAKSAYLASELREGLNPGLVVHYSA